MEINLSPTFYTQVGTTSAQTMKLLPSSRRGQQKVAIGDQNGVLTCFGMKRGDVSIVFKTLPGEAISRLQLGGPADSPRDRIYVSSGAEVRGFARKGKQFLTFDTNLTEPISSMWVEGSSLFVCDRYAYNHYLDCKDTDYFLCSDRINDLICLPSDPGKEHSPILACQDCTLRVLRSSELLYEVEVAGPPLCVALNGSDGGEDGKELLYGTQNGKMGLVKLEAQEPTYRWDMLNERKYGGISCIATSDLSSDGVPDIIVGRDDGVLEVYSFEDADTPRLKFTHMFGESVTSVDGGIVGSSGSEEVVVATYSGRVHGLAKESSVPQPISQEVQSKIEALKQEVEGLETRVLQSRERYQEAIRSTTDSQAVSALPLFSINDKFSLNQDEAWYTLAIEIQAPIDTIMLQSNVPVDLQEVDQSTAVVSYTPPDTERNNYLLTTFRCHDTNRLEVKVRSIEGQYGTLQAYITPRTEPKSCQVRQYQIKPLSLHQRVHSFDESRPCNLLRLTGPFSLGEAHSWVRYCLQGVPERPPAEDTATLHFHSTFVDSQLECTYKKGEAVFRSDNLSTISVLKEVLSKEATQRKIAVKISHELDESSVAHMLRLIYPRLEAQLMLAKNVQLTEALQEIKAHERDSSFLSPQCQFILENAELMQEELKQQPCMIERLYAIITDLYMDRASFKGQNVKDRVPMLLETLDNCDLNLLLQFFNST